MPAATAQKNRKRKRLGIARSVEPTFYIALPKSERKARKHLTLPVLLQIRKEAATGIA